MEADIRQDYDYLRASIKKPLSLVLTLLQLIEKGRFSESDIKTYCRRIAEETKIIESKLENLKSNDQVTRSKVLLVGEFSQKQIKVLDQIIYSKRIDQVLCPAHAIGYLKVARYEVILIRSQFKEGHITGRDFRRFLEKHYPEVKVLVLDG